MTDDVVNFWANAHNNKEQGPLTGTRHPEILRYFGFNGLIKPGKNVLCVGVGLGHCVREFSSRCNMYGMDICEEAFDKIKGVLKGEFIHKDSAKLPDDFFDLVYSFLVTQHMNEEALLLQLPNLIRSLKKDTGRLFIQFAGSHAPGENNLKERLVPLPGNPAPPNVQRMVRSKEYATELVEKSGGKVIRVDGVKEFSQYKSYWYYLVVSK